MHDEGRQPDHDRLFEIASEHGGYFTSAQARACGFSKALIAHHARDDGRFSRVRRGLYRLRRYPSSPREDVIAAWLAVDRNDAAISHESALDLLGLSDVIPDAVHITVPRSRRYRSSSPGIRIHTTGRAFGPDEIVERDGMRVTSVDRSILDMAQAGSAPDQVMVAITQSLERAMTTERRLLEGARDRGSRVERLVRDAILA